MTEAQLKLLREQLHQAACERNEETYLDPISQIPVFTQIAHLKRGECCHSGCRHCPYSEIKSDSQESLAPEKLK